MAVYKRGYQRYRGPLTGHWTRMLAMPRFAWQRLFQQRLVAMFMVVALVWPLLCAGFVYVANHSELWAGLGGDMGRFLQVDGRFFIIFMGFQATMAVLLASLAGPGLIAPDLSNNALPLYFSRPLTRLDYVTAKLMVLLGMLSVITWVPGLALFLMQSGMGGWNWLSVNWKLGPGLFIGFALWIMLVSLVALAASAYVKWRVVAGAVVLGFFFITAGASEMVNAVFRMRWGSLMNPTWATARVWHSLLDASAPNGPGTLECLIALGVMMALLALVLERKLRAVEVVS